VKVIWTKHAVERQKEWKKKKGITRAEIEQLIKNPEQIVSGHENVKIAQAKKEDGLIRVPFIESKDGRKILTLYWTSKIEKYWKE